MIDEKHKNELFAAREAARAKAFIIYQRVHAEWYAMVAGINACMLAPPGHLIPSGTLPDPHTLHGVIGRLRNMADEIEASVASNDEWRAAAAEAALAGLIS